MDRTYLQSILRRADPASESRRRTFLARSVTSLALAVGAILSAPTIDEAAARTSTLTGDHLTKKQRRRRNKRRAKRRRRNRQPGNPPGGYPRFNIRLIIENLTGSEIDFAGWTVDDNHQCRVRQLQTIPTDTAPTFAPGMSTATAVINDWYIVEVGDKDPDDGFPYIVIFDGGQMTKEHCLVGSPNQVVNREMGVGQRVERTVNGHDVEILRENDEADERIFRLRVKS